MLEPRTRRLAWSLAVGTGLIYLAFLPPGIYSLDGNSMLAVAESLVSRHSLSVPAGLGVAGQGGQIYSTWYPLQSFLAVPLVFVASFASRLIHVPLHFLAAAFVGVLPALYTAVTVALVALISLELGSTIRGAWLAALCYAGGTIALVYARSFYAEPLLSLLVAAAIYLVLAGSRASILLATLVAVLAILAKPTAIFLAPALSAYMLLKKKPMINALLPLAGEALGFFLYTLYNFFRFGHFLDFGPRWEFGLSFIPAGLVGLLVSPGRGLLWYSPAAFLAILGFCKAWKNKRLECLLIASLFGGFLALHAAVPYWHGGWAWGPRYLLPILPGLMALTSLLEGKAAKPLLALSLLGFLVSAPTLVSYYERYYAEINEQGVAEQDKFWSFSRAPFLHVWPAAMRQIEDARSQDVRTLFSQRSSPSPTIASSRALRVVALWWWVLPIAHIPQWLGALCAVGMILGGIWILARVETEIVPRVQVPDA